MSMLFLSTLILQEHLDFCSEETFMTWLISLDHAQWYFGRAEHGLCCYCGLHIYIAYILYILFCKISYSKTMAVNKISGICVGMNISELWMHLHDTLSTVTNWLKKFVLHWHVFCFIHHLPAMLTHLCVWSIL